jgi:hypothetical protein
MVLPILLLGLAPLGACEQVDGDGTPIDPGAVEGILEILPREVTLTAIGDTAHLNPGLKTTSGHRIEPDVALEWSVSNPQVASVSSSGRVTARGTGRTTVRGKAGQQVDSVIVVVTQKPSRVDASPDTSTLTAVGSTTELKAQVFDANGTAIPGASVSWYSTNPAAAEVNNTGRVTARGAGEARIVASAVGATADTVLVRVQPRPAKLTVSPESSRIRVGEAVQLTVTATDGNGAVIENPDVRWTSLNAEIASVNSRGRVTGVAAGKALIVVSAVCCGTADTASVIVDPDPSSAKPVFSDDFESYQVNQRIGGKGANGFRWTGEGVVVSDKIAHSGSRSIYFPYGPVEPNGNSHWWSEQRFAHDPVQEYWVEYYLYIPKNYYHTRESSANNNKLYAWWGPNGYSKPGMGMFQFWASKAGVESQVNTARYGPNSRYAEYVGPTVPFIDRSHLGQWIRIRIHIKLSDMNARNGVQQLWRNDDLIINVTGDNNNADSAAANRLIEGYLMGYDNGRYREQTDFYIDDFKIFFENPGWR